MKSVVVVILLFVLCCDSTSAHDRVIASESSFSSAPEARRSDSLKTNFPELGIVIGTPAWLNLVAGFRAQNIGMRLSGMAYSTFGGIEFSMTYYPYQSRTIAHGI